MNRCPECRHKPEATVSGECRAKLHPATKRTLSYVGPTTLWIYCNCTNNTHKEIN